MFTLASTADDFDAAQPISPQIARLLRQRIIRCEITPGDRISEAEVARDFGVSRQPVREAFIKLGEQGLVSILPQRGTIVSRITYAAVLDARFMREAIEADIVAILAVRPADVRAALVRELSRQIAAQRALDPRDAIAFAGMDELFHRTLARAAGKASAWGLLEGLKTQMDRVRFLSLERFPKERLVDQHATLVQRIETGDRELAETAIRLHLREVLHDLPVICAAHPEFFERPTGEMPQPVNAPIRGGDPE